MTERLTDKNPCRGCKHPAYYCDRCEDYSTYFDNLVEKLKKYEIAEAEKRIVVLPCKVGETVYVLRQSWNGWSIDKKKFSYAMIGKVGTTVFLTKEEAENELINRGNL